MITGEIGNFVAYGFASVLLVAPLGTVALISNLVMGPLLFGESLTRRDGLGVLATMFGMIIIVRVAGEAEEKRRTLEQLLECLERPEFLVYMIITLTLIMALWVLSRSTKRKLDIMVDLTIAGVIGGYTVLSIKAISSLMSLDFVKVFTYKITYITSFIFIVTGVLQIHFLNRALRIFEATKVIPINFVLFTTFSILGSTILYEDYRKISAMAIVGVMMMFLGVYLITGEPTPLELAYEPVSVIEDIPTIPEVALRLSPQRLQRPIPILTPVRILIDGLGSHSIRKIEIDHVADLRWGRSI